MGKLSLDAKKRFADIYAGNTVNNRAFNNFQFGTNATPAEDESNTAVATPLGGARTCDVLKRVNKQVVASAFFAAGTFGSGNVLREVGLLFADSVLAVRDTTNPTLPITSPDLYDIRVDVTMTIDQS